MRWWQYFGEFLESEGVQHGTGKLSSCSTRIHKQKFEAWRWKNLSHIESQRLHDNDGQDELYWMSNNMPSVSESKTKKQTVQDGNQALWICNEKVLSYASSACFWFSYFWFSQKSFFHAKVGHMHLNHMVCSHFHQIYFLMLQNKMFESYINTLSL